MAAEPNDFEKEPDRQRVEQVLETGLVPGFSCALQPRWNGASQGLPPRTCAQENRVSVFIKLCEEQILVKTLRTKTFGTLGWVCKKYRQDRMNPLWVAIKRGARNAKLRLKRSGLKSIARARAFKWKRGFVADEHPVGKATGYTLGATFAASGSNTNSPFSFPCGLPL